MINERLLILRKYLNLTQESFGSKLGVKKTAISKLEKGENNLTEKSIKLICLEFKVNEEWLRYGSGEMFHKNDKTIIKELQFEYNLEDFDIRFISSYLSLTKTERNSIEKLVNNIFLFKTI